MVQQRHYEFHHELATGTTHRFTKQHHRYHATKSRISKSIFRFVHLLTDNKRRKIDNAAENGNDAVGYEELAPSSSIHPESIIFEVQQVSFSSPIRKRMNLTFHLIEQNGQALPVMSIVNPANNSLSCPLST